MNTLEIKGVVYQKSSLIAEKFGYTTDYVGQLCRSGKVKAERVGRAWYVDPTSVLDYQDHRYEDEGEQAPSKQIKQAPVKKHIPIRTQEKVIEKKVAPKRIIDWGSAQPTAPVYVPRHAYEIDDTDLLPFLSRDESVVRQVKSNQVAIKKDDTQITLNTKAESETEYSFFNHPSVKKIPKKQQTILEIHENKLIIPDNNLQTTANTPKNRPYTTSRRDLVASRNKKRQKSPSRRLWWLRFMSLLIIAGTFAVLFWGERQIGYQKNDDQLSERLSFELPTWPVVTNSKIIHFFVK